MGKKLVQKGGKSRKKESERENFLACLPGLAKASSVHIYAGYTIAEAIVIGRATHEARSIYVIRQTMGKKRNNIFFFFGGEGVGTSFHIVKSPHVIAKPRT